MRSWRGWSWDDGNFGGSGLEPLNRICWSAREHLPMVIWSDAKASAVWRVTQVEHRPIGDDVFVLHDTGFVRNDANADIEGD